MLQENYVNHKPMMATNDLMRLKVIQPSCILYTGLPLLRQVLHSLTEMGASSSGLCLPSVTPQGAALGMMPVVMAPPCPILPSTHRHSPALDPVKCPISSLEAPIRDAQRALL